MVRLWVAAAVLLAVLLGFAVYEQIAFGWHPAREEVPAADGWAWFRGGLTELSSIALVAALAALPGSQGRSTAMTQGWISVCWAGAGVAFASCLLLLLSPIAYQRAGAEDGAIEWLSALFYFVGSGLFAVHVLRHSSTPARPAPIWPDRLVFGGFALLFFVMGMEEVSWFQRVIGFDTPESIAAQNWQGEFNLHNFHTDLTELTLYTGTGVFLMLLPLVREHLSDWRPVKPFAHLLPDRTIAALSAPMLVFTYSHWNLLPVQSVFWIGLGACIVFARSAHSAGRRQEGVLFAVLALFVAAGQALHLELGDTMLAMFDSSEYRELFFAVGLFGYAIRQTRPERA